MNFISQAVRVGLSALALGAGVAMQGAAPVITNITMVGATPRFAVQSALGITNQIQYSANLGQTNWVVLTNLWVAQSPYWFVDASAPLAARRFYRVAAPAASAPSPAGMVLIPAGSFIMGDTFGDAAAEGITDEVPTHTVYVSACYMDTNLLSYALWQQVYGWATNHGYSFDNPGSGKATNHPVQSINWYDCVKWCNARSEMAGLTPCYYTNASQATVYRTGTNDVASTFVNWAVNGYRLPTEAEWEKAARGGASGHRFPWTDADTITWSRANYYADSGAYSYDVNPIIGHDSNFTNAPPPYTSPVGSFAPNGYGLYDMAGNVSEWCWDWYSSTYYSSSPGTDPRGPVSGSSRVLRGGTWAYYADGTRCAYRDGLNPPYAYSHYFGFRCVRGF